MTRFGSIRLRRARAGTDLILQHAHHAQPGVVHFHKLVHRLAVAEQSQPWLFRPERIPPRSRHRWPRRNRRLRQTSSCEWPHTRAARRKVPAASSPDLGNTSRGMHAAAWRRSASRSSTLPCSTRTSRSVRPGEDRRRCCSSWSLVAGRDSISRLRTPSVSMKRSDSSFAPAPIASIPITAPTPKMIPSAVSSVRVFCAHRFEPACAEVGDVPRQTVRNRHRFTCASDCIALPRRRPSSLRSPSDWPAPQSCPSLRPFSTTRISLRRTSCHIFLP